MGGSRTFGKDHRAERQKLSLEEHRLLIWNS